MSDTGYNYSSNSKTTRNYWFNKLPSELNELNIITDNKRTFEFEKKELNCEFNHYICQRLKKVCKDNDLLLYIVLLTSMKVLMNKITNSTNILVTSPLFKIGEEQRKAEYVMLYDEIKNNMSFKDVLNSVKETVLDGYKYQNCNVVNMFRDNGVTIDDERICKLIFSLKNIHELKELNHIINSPLNDICIEAEKIDSVVECKFIYNSKLYNEKTIETISKCYKYILEQALSNINIPISELQLIDNKDENISVINGVEDRLERYCKCNVVKQFEKQVELTPDNIAVSAITSLSGNINEKETIEEITYRKINNKANQLAMILKANGVAKNSIVALSMNNSIEMVVGILGILKAGGTYLPIDIEYPDDRVKYILEDSNCEILLTQSRFTERFEFKGKIINVDNELIEEKTCENVENLISDNDSAYIIYTSGTTGNPKGVTIEHRSLMNFVDWRVKTYSYSEKDVTLQLISVSFDGFGANFYPSLLCGGKLIMVENRIWRNFDSVSNIITSQKVTNMSITPLMYTKILENKDCSLDLLRFIVLAGDRTEEALLKHSKDKYPYLNLINEYGPTENTITTTYFNNMNPYSTDVIGKPVQNNIVYILNKEGNLMPRGLAGELCISSIGITSGYINDKELTEQKILINPFETGKKMYKTGDLARINPQGDLEFLGRIDNQVKIRGYRVELQEIETQLNCILGGNYSAVVDREIESEERRIFAYIVCDKKIDIQYLRESLSEILPYYMIPSKFIEIDELPLTVNGKIDRKRLSNLKITNEMDIEYAEPGTETEIQLAKIWCSVLGVNKVGINQSFFDIGGTSLLLMDVFTQIEVMFPEKVTMPDLFTYTTISKLGAFIDKNVGQAIKHVDLNYIKLSEKIMNGSKYNSTDSDLKFDISGDMLYIIRNICGKYDMKIEEMMLYLFTYACGITFEVEEVRFQVKFTAEDITNSYAVDLGDINEISELITKVKDKVENNEKVKKYKNNDLRDAEFIKAEDEVALLIYSNKYIEEEDKLFEIFDICMGINENNNSIKFKCEFNNRKLNGNVIEKLANNFIKLIKVITSRRVKL